MLTGRDEDGRPTQVSRTVRGGKRDAQRVAPALTARPAPRIAGRTVADVLDAWLVAGSPARPSRPDVMLAVGWRS